MTSERGADSHVGVPLARLTMSALALLRANTSYRGPSLDFSNLMAADVGPLVLRHLGER